MRDWLRIQTEVNAPGRILTRTPWEIGVRVAHHGISYGMAIEADQYVLKMLKKAIFRAVQDIIIECSVGQTTPPARDDNA